MSPFADEDEKTTIESGWEEEASTTIEQGEVAEKIRTLGLRPITNVTGSTSNGHVMDEPTMDDQQANAGLSMITPAALHARMIITAGNDQGQEIEIIPGKTYTVGRAIDNDIVLTDIAVSRKHFDLRFESSTWVLVDRRSGNGTVINGNIEDAPFMLANGDSIEIGNTTFRFDHPHGVPRHAFTENAPTTAGFGTGAFDAGSTAGFEGSSGAFDPANNIVTRDSARFDSELEEEPSTVAGKPLRDVAPEPSFDSAFSRPEPRMDRMGHDRDDRMDRNGPATARPVPRPPSPRAERPRTMPPPPPAPLPRPKASSAVPFVPPISASMPVPQPMPPPAMLGAPPPLLPPPLVHGSQGVPAIASHRPTMLAQGVAPEPLMNMMPTTIPGQGPPVQPSSPQVHALPFTYPNMAEHAQHAQHLSARHVSAQLGQMQVVSTTGPRDATATAHVPPTPYNGLPVLQPHTTGPAKLSRRMKIVLAGAGLAVLAAVATVAIIKGRGNQDDATSPEAKPDEDTPTTPEVRPVLHPTAQPIDDKKADVPKDPSKDPKKDAKKDLKQNTTTPVEVPKDPPKDIVKKDPPKDPPKDVVVAKKDPPKDVVKKDPPKDPPKDVVKKDPPKDVVVKKDPPPPLPKKDPPKNDPPKKDPPKTRVAVATVKKDPPATDASAAVEKARSLYVQKQFLAAANTVKAVAGSDSKLRTLAAGYEKFATSYAIGMRQTSKAAEAWYALRSAMIFDTNNGGSAHSSDIQARRSAISAKAALGLASAKDYNEAVVALKVNGTTDGDAGFARRLVNDFAASLYEQARGEIDTNRKGALNKLRQVKVLTGSGALFNKADKLLNANAS